LFITTCIEKQCTWPLNAKKKETQTKKFLHHSSSNFFEFSSNLILEYGRKYRM